MEQGWGFLCLKTNVLIPFDGHLKRSFLIRSRYGEVMPSNCFNMINFHS